MLSQLTVKSLWLRLHFNSLMFDGYSLFHNCDCVHFWQLFWKRSAMKISASFKSEVKNCIEELQSGTRKRRPIKLDIDEALDCLFKVIRTGMQWREVSIQSASYCTLFKHAQKQVHSGIFHRAYSTILNRYASHNNGKCYITECIETFNVFQHIVFIRNAVLAFPCHDSNDMTCPWSNGG